MKFRVIFTSWGWGEGWELGRKPWGSGVMAVLFLIWVMDVQMSVTWFFITFYGPDIFCQKKKKKKTTQECNTT